MGRDVLEPSTVHTVKIFILRQRKLSKHRLLRFLCLDIKISPTHVPQNTLQRPQQNPGTCRTYVIEYILTLKAPITTTPDDIHKFFHCFSEKIRLNVSSESSARQRIHMKNQALFSSKDKNKKLKMSSAVVFDWRFKG